MNSKNRLSLGEVENASQARSSRRWVRMLSALTALRESIVGAIGYPGVFRQYSGDSLAVAMPACDYRKLASDNPVITLVLLVRSRNLKNFP